MIMMTLEDWVQTIIYVVTACLLLLIVWTYGRGAVIGQPRKTRFWMGAWRRSFEGRTLMQTFASFLPILLLGIIGRTMGEIIDMDWLRIGATAIILTSFIQMYIIIHQALTNKEKK